MGFALSLCRTVTDVDRALFATPISMDAALGGGGETVATGWNFNLKLGIR